ncbi:hypothetical protein HU200_061528 [Digitaria exilis]|uniref:Uncharacterized protein n=1 Tax=Digitaria exilis TaxID=1010633 RepID=A0A835A7B1_9POAL|nr:hypothetical protein HU200_061528 [Digitaria exilis]
MLLQPHPNPLAPLRASSSSSLAARLRLPFPSLLSRSTRRKWPPLLRVQASGNPHGLTLSHMLAHITLGSPPTLRFELCCVRIGSEPVRRSGASGLDALLSAAELLCLAPPAICSVVCAARLVFSPSSVSASAGPPPLGGGKLLVLQYLLLVGAVAIGSLIRRRQSGWLRPAGGAAEGLGVGLVERVDKVEDSVRGMVAAVGVLSRIVEKLGVRLLTTTSLIHYPFLMQTATLAQKNSEATRILAAQEHLLEKEIGAIQKVLCAMQHLYPVMAGWRAVCPLPLAEDLFKLQEQQQKQLDLILAIGEASTILGGEQDLLEGDRARSPSIDPTAEIETKQAKINSGAVTGGNNIP